MRRTFNRWVQEAHKVQKAKVHCSKTLKRRWAKPWCPYINSPNPPQSPPPSPWSWNLFNFFLTPPPRGVFSFWSMPPFPPLPCCRFVSVWSSPCQLVSFCLSCSFSAFLSLHLFVRTRVGHRRTLAELQEKRAKQQVRFSLAFPFNLLLTVRRIYAHIKRETIENPRNNFRDFRASFLSQIKCESRRWISVMKSEISVDWTKATSYTAVRVASSAPERRRSRRQSFVMTSGFRRRSERDMIRGRTWRHLLLHTDHPDYLLWLIIDCDFFCCSCRGVCACGVNISKETWGIWTCWRCFSAEKTTICSGWVCSAGGGLHWSAGHKSSANNNSFTRSVTRQLSLTTATTKLRKIFILFDQFKITKVDL